jgi:hypothetical protein
VSVISQPSLSLLTAIPSSARAAVRAASRADRGLVQNALGPDERLLAMLHGHNKQGSVTWLATNFRLVMLASSRPDDASAAIATTAITCVEQRTDPMGTWLRVRATGQQYCITGVEPAQAAQFCAVLRERAGIGASSCPPAPIRDPLRSGFSGSMAQSPR